MKLQTFSSMVVAFLASLTLIGCEWVDSAGGGEVAGQDALNVPNNQTEVLLDDVAVGDVIVINEKSAARLVISPQAASGAETLSWSEEAVEQGNLPGCAGQSGFDDAFAADSLQEACTDSASCVLSFLPDDNAADVDEFDTDEAGADETDVDVVDADIVEEETGAAFILQIPELKASIGISYTLNIEDDSGFVDSSERTFCLIAINEAPEAGSDTYTVSEGALLSITTEQTHLLSNDEDDIDTTNEDLKILPEETVGPQYAAEFDIGTDGSFTYRSELTNLAEDAFDNFEYVITDGLFQTTGLVTIRIAAANAAPEQVVEIPVLEATEGEFFTYDFAANFNDPEGGVITFSLDPETPLDDDSGLSLTSSGVLSGVPTEQDVKRWQLTVIASDGSQATKADFTLVVEEAEELVPNRPPVFTSGSVASLSGFVGEKISDIEPEFTDPDNDILVYTLAGTSILPPGVTLNRATGVISGTPSRPGFYIGLRVRATDPSGASALSNPAFTLTVKIRQ